VSVVGNDVVDLRDERSRGKAADERFVERIFTEEEAHDLRSARNPDRRLWIHWAAKETAFKVVTKLQGSAPTFEHRAFRVHLEHPGGGSPRVRGVVGHRGTRVPFVVEGAPDRIHVVGWHGGGPDRRPPGRIVRGVRSFRRRDDRESVDWRESLRDRFSDREWGSIHRPESALVRLRARGALARLLGVGEGAVEIVCDDGPAGRMPPRALVDGEPCRVDLSLSHHGRFLAWAMGVPRNDGDAATGS